jgi:uncharacterized protein RhaS with RHS repeats
LKRDWYDYGARFYDPQLGRWHSVDPAVENNHFEWSPYTYVYNNPIMLIDPFGLDSTGMSKSDFLGLKVFSLDISLNLKFWGAGAGVNLGPAKAKAGIGVLEITGEGKSGDGVSLSGKLGNVELNAGVENYIEGGIEGNLAEGSINANNGLTVNGSILNGSAEASSNKTQSSLGVSGSVVPRESRSTQKNLPIGNEISDFNIGGSLNLGPVSISAGVNPAAALKTTAVVHSYSQFATHKAPATPVFMMLKVLFGKY